MKTLNHSMRVYVPTSGNNGEDYKETADTFIKQLSNSFGGATVYSAVGFWEDCKDNMLIADFRTEEDKSGYAKAIASVIIKRFEQYAASIEIDGVLYIYDKEDIQK